MCMYMAAAIMPFQFEPEHNQCEDESEAADRNPPDDNLGAT